MMVLDSDLLFGPPFISGMYKKISNISLCLSLPLSMRLRVCAKDGFSVRSGDKITPNSIFSTSCRFVVRSKSDGVVVFVPLKSFSMHPIFLLLIF